ncbi:MAG TPA: tetratricopeptide repeat protein [Thermoanaerobaculia bacterium]|nr:tetratricopeptide repeat protein [Thermoanaerobaculia bacterium]
MYLRTDRGSHPTRKRGAALLGLLLWLAAGLFACGPTAEKGKTVQRDSSSEAEWAWLETTRQDLDRRRVRLAAGAQDEAFVKETEALSRELYRRLVEFINADPPVQGEPLSERQQAAIRMRSDEEIRLAREFIERGGDYQRAIDIYREALAVDPDNPRLREELARAQGRRYMTRQTFSQVQEGMDQDEVRRLLGQPNLHNVRTWPERGVAGWFYPKDAGGSAAAVWFRQEGERYVVYLHDFDALRPGGTAAPAPPEPRRPPQPPRSAT